jgi:hypothetical protein
MTIPSESAPAGSPDKSFRWGDIWQFISRPIAANQRVAGQRKPAGRSPAAARHPSASPGLGGRRKFLEISGSLWKSFEIFRSLFEVL